MIFVTVGTHEQQFDRLLREVDMLKEKGIINEEVFMQTGYSEYKPKYCQWEKFIKYDEMKNYINNARIVITHGGPASFLSVLEQKKAPIVVPRKVEFSEHVNNHQYDFAWKMKQIGYEIYVVDNIDNLSTIIINYRNNNDEFLSNNSHFNSEFKDIINNLIKGGR